MLRPGAGKLVGDEAFWGLAIREIPV